MSEIKSLSDAKELKWDDNIKMRLTQLGPKAVDWIYLA